jgi:hypothetical protein
MAPLRFQHLLKIELRREWLPHTIHHKKGFGCSQDNTQRSPTVPSPPVETAPRLVNLLGIVIDPHGDCVEGVIVEVVSGQALGQKVTQSTPCDRWDFGGGFIFKDLTPGVAMTFRASAPGWVTQEKTFVPYSFVSGQPEYAIEIALVQGA